jgi:cytochrome c peroxidase
MMLQRIAIAIITCFAVVSCKVDFPLDNDQPPVYDINFRYPTDFPAPVYNFENNALSEDGFVLGRKLFYDMRLSRDSTVSCGSCHQQVSAFAHSNHNFSHGIEGQFTKRNSPGLFNLAWHSSFMWDGGINHIEVQPAAPITNAIEMDETLENVVAKISADAGYRQLFANAFGDEEVTTQRMFRAISQFQAMLISDSSKYDAYLRGESTLTPQEANGLALFRQHCESCHAEPLFTDHSFRNNGLPVEPTLNDWGRMGITQNPADSLKFKVPSLRNIGFTYPYMHDGRFATLEEVVDHYRSGIVASPTLDSQLVGGINLTNTERDELILFLGTLNDEAFINDPRFAEP